MPTVDLFATNILSLFHCLFLATCVGSVATEISTYILLGIDFFINIYLCFDVWKKFKKNQWAQCGEALLTLVMVECLEMLVPVCYLVCFLVAFYGPNAETLGKRTS